MKRLLKRIVFAALYLVGATAFVLGGLELACRFGLVPNDAYRQKRAARRPGRHRVLLLGDSFSIEDPTKGSLTLGNQLRNYFARRGDVIVNLAQSGFGPADSLARLRYFRDYGPDYRPDLVIFNYYIGNDLTDEKFGLGVERQLLLPVRGAALLEHSYLVRLLRALERQRALNRSIEQEEQKVDAAPARHPRALNPFLVTEIEADRGFLAHNLLVDEPEDRAAWEDCKRVLREVKAYADSQHARFLINIFPETLQVDDSHYGFFTELGANMDRRYLTSTVPQDLLAQFCAEEGVDCNDLLPLFKRRRDVKAYIPNDDHWLEPGHTLAAEGIAAIIESRKLLP